MGPAQVCIQLLKVAILHTENASGTLHVENKDKEFDW